MVSFYRNSVLLDGAPQSKTHLTFEPPYAQINTTTALFDVGTRPFGLEADASERDSPCPLLRGQLRRSQSELEQINFSTSEIYYTPNSRFVKSQFARKIRNFLSVYFARLIRISSPFCSFSSLVAYERRKCVSF